MSRISAVPYTFSRFLARQILSKLIHSSKTFPFTVETRIKRCFVFDEIGLLLQSKFKHIPLHKRSHPVWYPLLSSLTSHACTSCSMLILWSSTIAAFSPISSGRVSSSGTHGGPRGRPAHPESAHLKAFLVRIREGISYTRQLRRFLLKHPLLVIELGFQLVLDPSAPYGFDCQRTLPGEQWLREKFHRRSRPVPGPAGCYRG